MGTYKYILHPALTKLVTPTTCLMIVSMTDFMVQVLSLSCGEQLHRCGIIGYNVLSNKTYEQKDPTSAEAISQSRQKKIYYRLTKGCMVSHFILLRKEETKFSFCMS